MKKPTTEVIQALESQLKEASATRIGELQRDIQKSQEELAKLQVYVGASVSVAAAPMVATTIPAPAADKKKVEKPKVAKAAESESKRKSLQEHIELALKGKKGGLTLVEIEGLVKQQGYESKSTNFSNMLYQCLTRMELKQDEHKKYKLG